jgi:hypothetical protein
MLFSSASNDSLPRRAKYILQQPILKQFILRSFLHVAEQISHFYKVQRIILFVDKTTESQTLEKEIEVNIP